MGKAPRAPCGVIPVNATETRLHAAREALITALAGREELDAALVGQSVQDALLNVAQTLGALGVQLLSDQLDLLMHAVRENRAATAAAMRANGQAVATAMRAYEDALADHLQAILLAQANTERRQDRRIDVLDAIVLGSPVVLPDEPDDPTGTDSGAHPAG